MGHEEAQSKPKLAREQLERAQVASLDPDDPEAAVLWSFYAYENAVVAAAEEIGIAWQKTHPSKQQAARDLHAGGHVSFDVSDELARLNELRKDVEYGEPGDDLQSESLQDLVADLGHFVDEVAELVEGKG